MPKVDFSSAILDLDGKPINEGANAVTLASVACSALLASYNDEANLAGDEKVKRFALALKAHDAKMVDLLAEDVVLLKKLIAKCYSPLVVGRAYALLEPPPV